MGPLPGCTQPRDPPGSWAAGLQPVRAALHSGLTTCPLPLSPCRAPATPSASPSSSTGATPTAAARASTAAISPRADRARPHRHDVRPALAGCRRAGHPRRGPGPRPLPRSRTRSASRGRTSSARSIDLASSAIMCTAGFPEPLAFSRRVRRHAAPPAAPTSTSSTTTSASARAARPRATAGRSSTRCTTRSPWTAISTSSRGGPWRRRRHYAAGTASCGCRCGSPPDCPVTHGVGDLQARHRRADGCRLDTLHIVPVGVDQEQFRPMPNVAGCPGPHVTTASADVPLKGLILPDRGAGQDPHGARRRAPGRDRQARPRERFPAPARTARSRPTRSSS